MTPPRSVKKAVFPVAGLGTRFLPATKAVAKELLPVVDRPLIQYAVEEAIEVGVDTLIFVISEPKRAILEHFRRDPELERQLEEDGKQDLLAAVRDIHPDGLRVEYAIQEHPLGLGHAVLCARDHVAESEFFAVSLPDDMIRTDGPGALAQLAAVHEQTGASVIGVERIDPALTGSYGIAEVEDGDEASPRITSLVEKPPPAEAPSNLGVVGRYVLDGAIFERLANLGTGAGGEIQLTDGIARLMSERPVHACPLEGVRYDCGNRLGMLKANLDYALEIGELRDELSRHIRARLAGRE